MAPDVVERLHDERVETATTTNVAGRTRKVRKDQHTLLTVVASHPALVSDLANIPALASQVADWEKRTVEWLRRQHGDALLSVVRHTDEAHAHLHAYVLPEDLRARALHPGPEAKALAVSEAVAQGADSKEANRRGDRAYRAAMRQWQDTYWREVGMASGLTRIGPARRRLSTADKRAEEALAVRTGELLRAAEKSGDLVGAARQAVEQAEAERDGALAAADAAVERERQAGVQARGMVASARRQASGIVAKAEAKAASLVAAAESQVERMRGIGAAVGGMLWGLVGQSPERVAARARAEAEEQAQVALRARERELQAELAARSRMLADARRERDNLVGTVREVSRQVRGLEASLPLGEPEALRNPSVPEIP